MKNSGQTLAGSTLLALLFLACGKLDDTEPPDGSGGSAGASSGGASRLVDIECGERHACGIDAEGSVRCWGAELTEEPPTGSFVRLASGKGYNCAIDDVKNLVCWGAGYYPPDDLPSNFALHAPTGQFDEVAISNDDENLACAWSVGGTLECWRNEAWMPMFAPESDDVAEVAVGLAVCVRDSAAEVTCASAWGPDDETFSEGFEFGDPALRFSDVAVSGPSPYACGITTDQVLHCWGFESTLRSRVEAIIGAVPDLEEFKGGSGFAGCGRAASGRLTCVGSLTYYSDGESSRILSKGFEDPPEPPFVDWCINRDYGCVLRDGGDVECWGVVPDEFPDAYIGDFYSCTPDDNTGEVICTGEKPAHLGDDYW